MTTPATQTLTDFLAARLDEDEAAARAAIAERDSIDFTYPPEVPDLSFVAWPDLAVPAVVVGPERVLAQVEALRAIVALHDYGHECPGDGQVYWADEDWTQPCPTLRHLAAIWRDHADWREEWAL